MNTSNSPNLSVLYLKLAFRNKFNARESLSVKPFSIKNIEYLLISYIMYYLLWVNSRVRDSLNILKSCSKNNTGLLCSVW